MGRHASEEPFRKVTLNLFESDVEWLERNYGWGWSELVRDRIHKFIHKQILTEKTDGE